MYISEHAAPALLAQADDTHVELEHIMYIYIYYKITYIYNNIYLRTHSTRPSRPGG